MEDNINISRRVGYACSVELIEAANKLPSNIGRALLVHTLIHAYGLIPTSESTEDSSEICEMIPVVPATIDNLAEFHDRDFIEFLLGLDNMDESDIEDALDDNISDYEDNNEANHETPHTHIVPKSALDSAQTQHPRKRNEKYGLQFDCPYFQGISDYVQVVSGASLACADYLIEAHNTSDKSPLAPVAINWQGGRHHAKRAKCSGFCYINDAVLCIQKLRAKFPRILYLDIDLHHGDGVETAFARSPKVLCMSVHRYGKGFYPGTGRLQDRGKGSNAIDYTLNIPTKRGFDGESLRKVFDEVIEPWKQWFSPDAVVVTCGADGLARDEHREWNLTVNDISSIVNDRVIDGWNLPTVVLGGGGYHHTDTARCWTYITAGALGKRESINWNDIPEHSLLEEYAGDAFQFQIDANTGKLTDENKGEYLESLIKELKTRLTMRS